MKTMSVFKVFPVLPVQNCYFLNSECIVTFLNIAPDML